MSLVEVLQIERERVRRERLVLDTVYERMGNRINCSVRAGSKTCIYTIPDMIPGYPLVNITKTMMFLLNKLKKEGFIALPLSEYHILITWDPNELRKLDSITKSHEKKLSQTDDRKIERENEDFINSLIKSKIQDRNN